MVVLSPHPGRVREEFAIDLPRPRDPNMSQVAAKSAEVMHALKGWLGEAPQVAP